MANTKMKTGTPETNGLPTAKHRRNDGIPFDANLFKGININRSAVERRAATITKRRSVKKQWQAAWLLKAISCIDLTTLAGDDTRSNVIRLCAKAQAPVRQDLLDAMGMGDAKLQVGAVCVYHNMIGHAGEALQHSSIPIAAVINRISRRKYPSGREAQADRTIGSRRRQRDRYCDKPGPGPPI